RQLLGAVNGKNNAGGPQVKLYDIGGDCRFPQLLSSTVVGTGTDGGAVTAIAILGHEGTFAPDGLTYYGADVRNKTYYPVDITNSTKPKLIMNWPTKFATSHGLSFSDDGNTAFMVSQA